MNQSLLQSLVEYLNDTWNPEVLMLYQSNHRKESGIEPYDFMVVCDVCLRPICHLHREETNLVLAEARKDENICLRCKKKGFHWKAWHGSSIP